MTDTKKKAPQAALTLAIGDENENGKVDVTLTCTVLGKTWPSVTKDLAGGPGIVAAALGLFAFAKDAATQKPGETIVDEIEDGIDALMRFMQGVAPFILPFLARAQSARRVPGIGGAFNAQGEHASSLD